VQAENAPPHIVAAIRHRTTVRRRLFDAPAHDIPKDVLLLNLIGAYPVKFFSHDAGQNILLVGCVLTLSLSTAKRK